MYFLLFSALSYQNIYLQVFSDTIKLDNIIIAENK